MAAILLLLTLFGRLDLLHATHDDDWTELARLTLANYALTKADGAPPNVFCSKKGHKAKSCHCWNFKGNPEDDGDGHDCDVPTGCLVYSTKNDGNLSYAKLNSSDDIHTILSDWSVPPNMTKSFDLALLTENATFTTFDFTLNPGAANYEAHVGTARLYQGERFIGYTYGKSKAELIEPEIRTAKTGDCHGQNGKKRGFNEDELNKIREALASAAFKTAAKKAQPVVVLQSTSVFPRADRTTDYSQLLAFRQIALASERVKPLHPQFFTQSLDVNKDSILV